MPFNPEGIDIDQAGGIPPVTNSVKLECSDATLADMANKACFFKGFPGCNFMGARPRMGLPLGIIQRPPPLEVTRQTSTPPFGLIKNGSAAIWCKALFRFMRLRTY